MARQAITELVEEHPEYRDVEIEMINEDEHPEIIENYDYWSVPSLFINHEKIFEAALFMPYETIKDGVKLAFDKALEEYESEADSFEEVHDPCLRFQK